MLQGLTANSAFGRWDADITGEMADMPAVRGGARIRSLGHLGQSPGFCSDLRFEKDAEHTHGQS